MFNSRGKRNPKKKVTKEVLVADGRTQATIPVRGGAGLPNPESKLSLDFVANAVTTVTITWRNILDLVVMGTTTTQLADVFYSCRLHSVEIWTPDAAAGDESHKIGIKLNFVKLRRDKVKENALDRGRDIAHADAEAFGWNPDDLEWKAVPFEEDNIPEDMRVGSRYL